MAIKYLASHGPKGWIIDGPGQLDQMMAWAYASNASQSLFFNGDVTSIAAILQTYGGRILEAAPALKEALTRYLGKVFDNVVINVDPVEKMFPNHYLAGELMLSGSVVDWTGQELQLHEVMSNKGSAVRTVLDYIPS